MLHILPSCKSVGQGAGEGGSNGEDDDEIFSYYSGEIYLLDLYVFLTTTILLKHFPQL